jgi:hypothetical protein
MALERVESTSERTEIGPLRLYREDLMRIWEILSQLGSVEAEVNGKFKITEPSGWEELARSTREPVTSVKFNAKGSDYDDPRISVTLHKKLLNYIYVYQVTHEARGLVSVLKEELREHRRFNPPFWLTALASGLAGVPVAVLLFLWLDSLGAEGGPVSLVVYSTVMLFVWLGVPLADVKSKIVNVTYAEAPRFRERLLEDQGVALFWTVVGVALGGVVGYLVNQLPPLAG